MNDLSRIVELSKEQCFSVWYDPNKDSYYPDHEKTDASIWICDIERETDAETLLRMTQLMLSVTEEFKRKGYLK